MSSDNLNEICNNVSEQKQTLQGQISDNEEKRENCTVTSDKGNSIQQENNKNDNQNENQVENQTISKPENVPESLVSKVSQLDISENASDTVKLKAQPASAVVINKESDSLKNLLVYDDSSSSEGEYGGNEKNWQLNALESTSSSSDSEEDSFYEHSSDEDDTDDDVDNEIFTNNKSKGAIKKAKVEKGFEECLPPIPDLSKLNISVENEEFIYMGNVAAIIDNLVTVEALPGTPAFDLDSYLFIEDKMEKKPVGQIFDVLGPVTSPLYCVRFNTNKDIQDLKLETGTKIYAAPKSELTKYVFVKELMKMKGSDASWLNDCEVPREVAEFSDDEEEQRARAAKRNLKRKHGSLERHKRYEKTMNQCNILNTRVSRLIDAHQQQILKPIRPPDSPRAPQNVGSAVHPAPFDPSIPPPGFGYGYTSVPSDPQDPMGINGFFPLPSIPAHLMGNSVQASAYSLGQPTVDNSVNTSSSGGVQSNMGNTGPSQPGWSWDSWSSHHNLRNMDNNNLRQRPAFYDTNGCRNNQSAGPSFQQF